MNIALLDPDDQALVTIDWSDVLTSGVTLSGSVLHIVPLPLTKTSESTDIGTNRSQVRIAGAVHGALYMVSAQATLSNGETINRQFPLRGWNS